MTDVPRDPGAHEDLDSLLGAFALDALDADDTARVGAYLERDAAARAEVDDMRETAASLALLPVTEMEAPPELWDRISGAIAAERAQAERSESPTAAEPPTDELAARRARSARPIWMQAVAVAAAVAIAVLTVKVVSLDGQLHKANRLDATAAAAAFDRATKVDGARLVALKSGSGADLARIVLLPDGTGYMRGDHMAALPSDRTYQLWAITGTGPSQAVVSAGVLGPDPGAVTFRASGPVHGFAVTIEHAGGVVSSKQKPIASAQLS
jgi:anti-sigma-K factor RskA